MLAAVTHLPCRGGSYLGCCARRELRLVAAARRWGPSRGVPTALCFVQRCQGETPASRPLGRGQGGAASPRPTHTAHLQNEARGTWVSLRYHLAQYTCPSYLPGAETQAVCQQSTGWNTF